MSYNPRTNYKGPAHERIAANRIVTDSNCWEYPGSPSNKYPTISHEGCYVTVHRYMYQHYKGPIPKGHYICHTCDNTRCHNPEHLYAGTPKQNAQDCVNRQRHAKKYDQETASKILAMRELTGMPGNTIAVHLGLSKSGVNNFLSKLGLSYQKGGYQRYVA